MRRDHMPIEIRAEDQVNQPAQTSIPEKPGKAEPGDPAECRTWGDTPPKSGNPGHTGSIGLPGATGSDGVDLNVPNIIVGQVTGNIVVQVHAANGGGGGRGGPGGEGGDGGSGRDCEPHANGGHGGNGGQGGSASDSNIYFPNSASINANVQVLFGGGIGGRGGDGGIGGLGGAGGGRGGPGGTSAAGGYTGANGVRGTDGQNGNLGQMNLWFGFTP